MEDAHVIHAQDTWGFFGVFDGHGGDECSTFISKRIREELEKNCAPPGDDNALKDLALRLDKEFLDSSQAGGSTGTFVVVSSPTSPGGNYHLQVGNIGDSRVLLGKADGTIFKGPGTDFGLTIDHKPCNASEEARINAAGGYVKDVNGVSRVNGDLAVSRAFGDRSFKTGTSNCPEAYQVSAVPDITHEECTTSDFLILVCDGISESPAFPNADVVRIAAEHLQPPADGSPVDPAKAAIAVCHEAVRSGSKDNLSCMIVLFGGGEVPGKPEDFIPGLWTQKENGNFYEAYQRMARHSGLTVAQALEKRYALVEKVIHRSDGTTQATEENTLELLGEKCSLEELKEEMRQYDDGPPPALAEGSDDRVAWFEAWLNKPSGRPSHLSSDFLAMRDIGLRHAVVDANVDKLREAVELHPELRWDERLVDVCHRQCCVIKDDDDGTSQVQFADLKFKAWLPTSTLVSPQDLKVSEDRPAVVDDAAKPREAL